MDENKEFENREPEREPYIDSPAGSAEADAPADTSPTDAGETAGPDDEFKKYELREVPPAEIVPPAPPAAEAAMPVPKSNKGIFALLGVAAGLIILILAVLLFSGLNKTPEDAVAGAFSKTGQAMERMNRQIVKKLPFYQLIAPSKSARASTYKISADSLDMSDIGLQSELLDAMVKMYSFSGSMVTDPSAGVSEMSGALNMGDTALIDFFIQYSPDQIAFNIPKFSDTVLGVNPNTVWEDYQNGPLYGTYYFDEDAVADFQERYRKQMDAAAGMGRIDYRKLQRELYDILWDALTGAAYEEPLKQGGQKVYTVRLDGVQTRKTLIGLFRFIYLESDLALMYPQEMKDMVRETLIVPLEEGCPPLPATMVLTVGKKGEISRMDLDFDTTGIDLGGGDTLDALQMNYEMPNGVYSQKMSIVAAGSSGGEPVDIRMDVSADYTNSGYKAGVTMSAKMFDDSLDMNANFDTDKTGAVNMGMQFGLKSLYATAGMTGNIKGSVTKERDVTKWEFPTIQFTVNTDDFAVGIGFKANGEVVKLKKHAQPADATPLFSMTEQEWAAELQKYNDGLSSLFGYPFGGTDDFGGSDGFGGIDDPGIMDYLSAPAS